MYLSRIQLRDDINQCSQLGLLIKDRKYGIHRLLWDLFPNGKRVLFRQEMSQEQVGTASSRPLFYVLSEHKPEKNSPLFQSSSKIYQPNLSVGDELHFKLRANPVVSKKIEGKKNSSKHDVVMDAQFRFLRDACEKRNILSGGKKRIYIQALLKHADFSGKGGQQLLDTQIKSAVNQAMNDWLMMRSQKNGFKVLSVQSTSYRWHALPEKSKDRNAGFSSLDYEGILAVEDVELFMRVLTQGMGSAKAFGCGLMLVRRL